MIRHRSLSGELHPFYRAILLRAIGVGYTLPSLTCQRLQNNLVRQLVNLSIWSEIDYLYVFADDSGATDMMRINWAQPAKALSTGSPTYVHKKGMYGSMAHSFNIATDQVAMGRAGGGTDDADASQFAWLTENGGAIASVEALCIINGLSAGNGRLHAIRLRTNPRVDCLFNVTTASPAIMLAGLPSDNQMYYQEVANLGTVTVNRFVNGVNTFTDAASGSGLIPDTGTLATDNITSSRALGIIGGGGALMTSGATKPTLLYNAFSAYMTELQTLA
jgi:hypothetical protein